MTKNIAIVIYNIISVLDPERIIIGGKIARHFDELYPLIEEYLKRGIITSNSSFQIVKNDIAGETGLLGSLVIKKM